MPLLVKEHVGWVRVQVGGYGVPCGSSLGTDLQEIMATSRDQKELLWAWQGWRDAVGRQLRPVFEDYVRLSNKAAQYNGKWAGHNVLGVDAQKTNEAESAEDSGSSRIGMDDAQGP